MKKILRGLLLVCLLMFLTPRGAAMHAGAAGDEPILQEPAVRYLTAEKAAYRNTLHTAEDGKLYYYNARGNLLKSSWKTIDGKRYYFKKSGAAATGITKIHGKYYLFSKKGVLQRNKFKTIDDNIYYAGSDGRIATGWQTIDGKRYCFKASGAVQTGWFEKGGKTYHSNRLGVAAVGWKHIRGKAYYFDTDGALIRDRWIGSRYVNKNGVYKKDKKPRLTALKTRLSSAIRSYGGSWSVYVQNLDTGESFSINNRSMYAASLIKLYAMGAAYERIRQHALSESSVSGTISDMITVSDNGSFNTIVRRIGTTYINTWCRQNGYTGTNQGHGLSPSSNNYGLSNGTGSNMTSVLDCGKFLESVYRGTCVSKSASAKMLGFLKRQTRRWKIPAGVPGGVTVANKTGETDNYTHDAAIVYSKGADYILVVMGQTPGSGWASASRITGISRIVYDYFN